VFHTAIVMKVVDGNLDAYRTDHQNLWPEVDHAMRRDSIDMAIYHHNGFLFVFATAPSEEHWVRSRKDPVFTAWNARMAQLLESDDKGNILFYSPEKVFGFGSFT
jgi:L-rhamnose mutarotase